MWNPDKKVSVQKIIIFHNAALPVKVPERLEDEKLGSYFLNLDFFICILL